MNSSMSTFEKHPSSQGKRAERRNSPQLAAYHLTSSGLKQNGVKDISSTGIFLLTREPWNPGESVSLTLQRKGPPEKTPENRVTLKTTAVRRGEDGVALKFILPTGVDLRLWQSPLKADSEQTEPEDILKEFRMAEALAFLGRICPSAAREVNQLLREGLSNYRLASAIEIALRAEAMLAVEPDAGKRLAPPHLVMRILEGGSWADVDSIQQLWAGLLAASCTIGGEDESNSTFVDLLSQLPQVHVRILVFACIGASRAMPALGGISSRSPICTTKEIMKMTGSRDMIRIERDLQHLIDLGLLQRKGSPAIFSDSNEGGITPTNLGLQLYARCNGLRGSAQDFLYRASLSMPTVAREQ